MHFQERQQAHAAECSRVYRLMHVAGPAFHQGPRGPFETEIQARFTPIRVLTQAVKTVAYLRVSTAQQDVRSQHPRQQTNRGEASFTRD